MSAREPEPPRSPPSPRPSQAPSRPTEPPRQPEPSRQYATSGQMAQEANERRLLSPAERKTRNAARQLQAEKAMAEHERAQKALHENRARLKAES
jgi:hypothetical protein